MIYDQKITLEQAELLDKIALENCIEILALNQQYQLNPVNIRMWDFGDVYTKDNRALSISRPDYAQYIIGNEPLPEGYGYPSKELSRVYEGLEYRCTKTNSKFVFELPHQNNLDKWWLYIFHSEDLARVEAEAEPERTEINAAQVIWCLENPVQDPAVNKHWCNGKEYMRLCLVDYDNVTSNPKGYCYEILTTTYNSLPDEFKALADPKPSMPAHFADSTDWKAKYIELKAQSNQYKSDFEVAVKLNKTLADKAIAKEYELMVQIDKLKNYIINQLINE